MDGTTLAIVRISAAKALRVDDVHEVVRLLRNRAGVDDFSVNYGEIMFHLWGEERVDLTILDRIRDALKAKYPSLRISAEEYRKTGRSYGAGAKRRPAVPVKGAPARKTQK